MGHAEIGVFGGSGFYSLFDSVEERQVETPYGFPSAPVAIGDVRGRAVTDYDVGVEGHEPVSAADVLRVFGENNERLRELLHAVIPRIGPQPDDACARALDEAGV